MFDSLILYAISAIRTKESLLQLDQHMIIYDLLGLAVIGKISNSC